MNTVASCITPAHSLLHHPPTRIIAQGLTKDRAAAQDKIERVKRGHDKALQKFATQQQKDRRSAELIHLNIDAVQVRVYSMSVSVCVHSCVYHIYDDLCNIIRLRSTL
jgi:hypothetical protein